jgi:hypothetical protein
MPWHLELLAQRSGNGLRQLGSILNLNFDRHHLHVGDIFSESVWSEIRMAENGIQIAQKMSLAGAAIATDPEYARTSASKRREDSRERSLSLLGQNEAGGGALWFA